MTNKAAVTLGKMRSKRKAAAARANGLMGGRPRTKRTSVVTLPGGIKARAYAVKCYRPGCRRVKRGFLSTHGSGGFYNKHGKQLADLREVDYACPEHGIADGSAPFLYPDPPKRVKATPDDRP